MRTSKREKQVNGERWFAEYSQAKKQPEADADFRFVLGRTWNVDLPPIMFIGLNPSTATHLSNDPTVAGCVKRARAWGFGGLFMMNLFPYRATDPEAMKRFYRQYCNPKIELWAENTNYDRIRSIGEGCEQIVCCWGNHGAFKGRGVITYVDALERFKGKLTCLTVTKQGEPQHPLYISQNTKPKPYSR